MAEEVHSQQCRRRAAKGGEEEQRGLGDATGKVVVAAGFTTTLMAIADGFPLVETIGKVSRLTERR